MSTLRVSIWRGRDDGRFVTYEVPRQASQTVLDVVTHVQRHVDPSLSYRFACRVGMCGSCAMTVNGVARWTCRTHVSKVVDGKSSNRGGVPVSRPAPMATSDAGDAAVDGTTEGSDGDGGSLTIAPLANLPVIKDLVTDMREFFDKWARAKGQFKGASTRQDDFARVMPASPQRRLADAGIECIGCGVCYASCDVVAWRPDFAGPAALNRAWTLVNDVRDVQQPQRLRAVAGDAGCHACHTQGSCTERCPKQLAPTAAIAGLKRATARAAMRGKL